MSNTFRLYFEIILSTRRIVSVHTAQQVLGSDVTCIIYSSLGFAST